MNLCISQGNIAVGAANSFDRTRTQRTFDRSNNAGLAKALESLIEEIGLRVVLPCETATKIPQRVQACAAYFTSLSTTKKVLAEIELCSDVVAAYNICKELLDSNWSEYGVAWYMESNANVYRHVLLGCIADEGIELSTDLNHCLVGLLHSKDPRIVNCACLALLAGGTESSTLLRESVVKLGLHSAKKFLEDCLSPF